MKRCLGAAGRLPYPVRGARRPELASAAQTAGEAAVKCLAGAPQRSPRRFGKKRFQSRTMRFRKSSISPELGEL